jgi:hypothetical protein
LVSTSRPPSLNLIHFDIFRFDFAGSLLPYDNENISVKAGLHHHGEEPERPGYTLEELLTLVRR